MNGADHCVIVTSDKAYLSKALATIAQIRSPGGYGGDIVLSHGDDIAQSDIPSEHRIIAKHFKDFDRSDIHAILKKKNIKDTKEFSKAFQWHKLHLFDVFFKKWKWCLAVDAGMHVYNSLDRLFNMKCPGSLVAHSDAYPLGQWRLTNQFNSTEMPELYQTLSKKFNLDRDYFQTGLMLYDTDIIKDTTKDELVGLSKEFHNCRTNDQGIINLHFNCRLGIWKTMPVKDDKGHLYDYWERNKLRSRDYVMLKYPKT